MAMRLSGVQPFTMLDYPGRIACIAFTPGCNFRCGYCHNPEFVLPERLAEIAGSFIPEEAFFAFLSKRIGLLEGVVVTGGEPTIHADLLGFLAAIKERGFAVKLDTNGSKPEVVRSAITQGVVDYVAMDVKTSLGGYRALVDRPVMRERLAETIGLLREGRVAYELRMTLIKEVHSREVLEAMACAVEGVERVYLQSFRPQTTLSPLFQSFHPFSPEEMQDIVSLFASRVGSVSVRA